MWGHTVSDKGLRVCPRSVELMELVGYTWTRGRRLIFYAQLAAAPTALLTRRAVAPGQSVLRAAGRSPRVCGRRRVYRPRGRQEPDETTEVTARHWSARAIERGKIAVIIWLWNCNVFRDKPRRQRACCNYWSGAPTVRQVAPAPERS
jgi:hypothetical protein